MPVVVTPIAGAISDRIGARSVVAVGLAMQAGGLAWLAVVDTPTVSYPVYLGAFLLSGLGMSLFFAPIACLVLHSVSREEEGIASGVNNMIREIGGVLGIAVMGAIFTAVGGYGPTATVTAGQHFTNGMVAATAVGVFPHR